ncbi:hypothetical protein B0H13DRAFT_1883724 [Mycena leptocephala]|nr:hypothetical protein B0H13DRAFT_1883724 [Mycena leptocephala]
MREFPRTGPTVSKPSSSSSTGAVHRVESLGEKGGFLGETSMIGDHGEKNAKRCQYRCADENFSRGDILRGADFAKPELVISELAEQRRMSNGQGSGAVMSVVKRVVNRVRQWLGLAPDRLAGWQRRGGAVRRVRAGGKKEIREARGEVRVRSAESAMSLRKVPSFHLARVKIHDISATSKANIVLQISEWAHVPGVRQGEGSKA